VISLEISLSLHSHAIVCLIEIFILKLYRKNIYLESPFIETF
jgi:hypothetical protein